MPWSSTRTFTEVVVVVTSRLLLETWEARLLCRHLRCSRVEDRLEEALLVVARMHSLVSETRNDSQGPGLEFLSWLPDVCDTR